MSTVVLGGNILEAISDHLATNETTETKGPYLGLPV